MRRLFAPSCTAGARSNVVCAIASVLLVLASGFHSPSVDAGQTKNAAAAVRSEGWAPGRILVQPRVGLSDSNFDQTLKSHGGKSVGRLKGLGVHIVQLPPGISEQEAAEKLSRHPHIKFAEVDRKVPAASVPNDPYFASIWHLAKIGTTTAWDVTSGSGVKIAVLDSGVDGTHPDLAAQMVAGWNFVDNNSNTADVNGHGTAVAGAAAAATNNGAGVAGVAGGAKIMPVRIADANAYAYWSTVAQGLTWAADNGARVANISYVGVTGSSTVQSAAQYLKNKGGLVVVCAGNAGAFDATAQTAAMITVSATDQNDALTKFSSYGNHVDVSAPGIDIWSTNNAGGYGQWWGTSFASPIVAGTVALMMAAKPSLQASDYEQTLIKTVSDLGTPGYDINFGYGRVDAAAAVKAIQAVAVTDTMPPTATIASPTGGSTVRGLVAVDVNTADNVGVARVDLFVNGTLLGSDSSAPFGFSWDTAQVRDGAATLTAVAYDAAGNASTKANTSVSVSNVPISTVGDTTAPSVAITSPANGSFVGGNVTIDAVASDNLGAARISLAVYIDGALKAIGNGGTVSYVWNTKKASKGVHTIDVTATDAAGNQSSATAQVTR